MKHPRPSRIPLCILAQLGLLLVLAYMFVAQTDANPFQDLTNEEIALRREGRTIIADVRAMLDINAERGLRKEVASLQSSLSEACASGLTFLGEWTVECSDEGGLTITASHPKLEKPVTGHWSVE